MRSRILHAAVSAVTGWQELCTVSRSAGNARCLNLGGVRNASSAATHELSSYSRLNFARCLAGVAAVDPHAGRRRHFAFRRNLPCFRLPLVLVSPEPPAQEASPGGVWQGNGPRIYAR